MDLSVNLPQQFSYTVKNFVVTGLRRETSCSVTVLQISVKFEMDYITAWQDEIQISRPKEESAAEVVSFEKTDLLVGADGIAIAIRLID